MNMLIELKNKKQDLLKIAATYGLKNLRVFGSVAKMEDDEKSDVDLLVDTEPFCSLLEMGGAVVDFETCLGRKVDVVTVKGLKNRIRDKVLSEAIPL